jgi:hypothetical protein
MSLRFPMPQLDEAYLVFPCPECSTVLDPFALDDIDHGSDRHLRTDDTLDIPRDVDFGHVASVTVSRCIAIGGDVATYVATSPGCIAMMMVSSSFRFNSAAMC